MSVQLALWCGGLCLLLPVLACQQACAARRFYEPRNVRRRCVLGSMLCLLLGRAMGALPEWLVLPGIVLTLASVGYVWLPEPAKGWRTPAYWGLTAVVVSMLGVALANQHFGGELVEGLSNRLCELVILSPNRSTLLIRAWQSGLSRLSGALTEQLKAVVSRSGAAGLTMELTRELLGSLHTTLVSTLLVTIPSLCVRWTLYCACASALTVGFCCREHGRRTDLPALSVWYLPRKWGWLALGVMVLGLVRYMTANPATALFALLCQEAAFWVFAAQGLAVCYALLRKGGRTRVGGAVLCLLGLSLAPALFQLLGLMDQMFDFRHLRKEERGNDGADDHFEDW